MINDRVKTFESWDIDGVEKLINEWLGANPEFYIREIKICEERDKSYYAYIWYTEMKLEEERE